VIVWLVAPHSSHTLLELLMAWKLPVVITFIFGIFSFVSQTTKERLERRNVELEQAVESGTAQIAMQEQELERAREIQSSLLPKEIPQLAGFEVAGAWQPALTVSGDYYDVLRLDGHRLGICIADVAGKGVSAALLMANVQAAVRAFADSSGSPAEMCSKVNALLHENVATGKFVTFLYGVLDAEKRTFRYCNAGHLPPIVFSNGEARTVDGGGAVLGVFPSWSYEDAVIELKTGDRLLLFTDGITEAADASGQEFGETGIADFVKANSALAAKELNSRLLKRVTEFCDAQFHDDATVLVIAAL
jgi:sigma-B regulation protein RsbU (phosphoserine phosphatase)